MWYTGKVKTPRVTEGPSQIKATASTPRYLFDNILPSARRLVKWAAFVLPKRFLRGKYV
jgi:hypothetical protein